MIVTIQNEDRDLLRRSIEPSVDRSTRRFTSVGWRRRERASPRTWSAPRARAHARVGCSIPAPVFFYSPHSHARVRRPPTSATFASVSPPVHSVAPPARPSRPPSPHRADVLTTRARAAAALGGADALNAACPITSPEHDPGARKSTGVVRHGHEHRRYPAESPARRTGSVPARRTRAPPRSVPARGRRVRRRRSLRARAPSPGRGERPRAHATRRRRERLRVSNRAA